MAPASFVLFETICEFICGVGLLYHAKRFHDKGKNNYPP
jgi:hypothetical protein